jgi:hypothetical protein
MHVDFDDGIVGYVDQFDGWYGRTAAVQPDSVFDLGPDDRTVTWRNGLLALLTWLDLAGHCDPLHGAFPLRHIRELSTWPHLRLVLPILQHNAKPLLRHDKLANDANAGLMRRPGMNGRKPTRLAMPAM